MNLSCLLLLAVSSLNVCGLFGGEVNPTIPLSVSWWRVSELFTNMANNALYKRDMQDVLENEFEWTMSEIDPALLLKNKVSEVENLFKNKVDALTQFKNKLVESFSELRVEKPKIKCCSKYKQQESENLGCLTGKEVEESLIANMPKDVMMTIQNLYYIFDNQNLYVSTIDGGIYLYPYANSRTILYNHCRNFDPHIRPWYLLGEAQKPRDVVLLIDIHKNEDKSTRKLNSAVAKSVLGFLSTDDRIVIATKNSLILNSDRWRHVRTNVWLIATPRNINNLVRLLNEVILGNNVTIQEFYDFFSFEDRMTTVQKLFDSPVKLSINTSRIDPVKVLIQISSRPELTIMEPNHSKQMNTSESIIITYYTGKKVPENVTQDNLLRNIVHIQHKDDMELTKNRLSSFFNWSSSLSSSNDEGRIRLTMPYRNYYNNGILSTLTLPLIINGTFQGVVATDFLITHDPKEIQTIFGIQNSYSFLVDNQGRTIFHPLLPSPSCILEKNVLVQCKDPTLEFIDSLEQEPVVLEVLQSMINMEKGNKTVLGHIAFSNGQGRSDRVLTLKPAKLLYLWSPLNYIKMSLAIVLPMHEDKIFQNSYACKDKKRCENLDFHYHLDFERTNFKNCTFFGANVLKEEGLVKFAPSLFHEPILYQWNENLRKDPVVVVLEEGSPISSVLKGTNIETNIRLVESLEEVWKRGNHLSCYVGIRSIGTPDGIYLNYPGMRLNSIYDARRRHWYQIGASNIDDKNILSLTLPYMDFFSGGQVITLVSPLVKRYDSGFKFLVAVTGADFSIAFLRNKLRSILPKCDGSHVECFLMNSLGYIVLHLNKPSADPQHITEAEPSIAQALIEARFLRKTGCHDYEQDLIYLYWTFELCCEITTYSYFENGTKFSIYQIPYMNVYLVAKEHSENIVRKQKSKENNYCQTTCLETVEPPCIVVYDISCPKEEEDMRSRFPSMSACLPSDKSHSKGSFKPCEFSEKNTCYSLDKKECQLWKPLCLNNKEKEVS